MNMEIPFNSITKLRIDIQISVFSGLIGDVFCPITSGITEYVTAIEFG
jgi:hypothetical protein